MSPISSVFRRSPPQNTHQAAIDDRSSDDLGSSQDGKPNAGSTSSAEEPRWASKVPAEEVSGVRESLLNEGRKHYSKMRGKYVVDSFLMPSVEVEICTGQHTHARAGGPTVPKHMVSSTGQP